MIPVEPNVDVPEGWRYVVFAKNQKEYIPLPGLQEIAAQGHFVSCWKMNWKERLQILLFGKLWHVSMTFHQALQPIILSTEFPLVKE